MSSPSSSSLFSDLMDPIWDSLAFSDENMTDYSFEMVPFADQVMTASGSGFEMAPFPDEGMTASNSNFEMAPFPDESMTASSPSFEMPPFPDEGITASSSSFEMGPFPDEGMTASSPSFDMTPFPSEGMMASSSNPDITAQMGNMDMTTSPLTSSPSPQARFSPTVPHLHPRFDRTHPPVVAAEMTRLWREMPSYKQLEALLNAGIIDITEFRKQACNLEQHVSTPPIATAMAPRGSYFAADGSEYTTARFPGYDDIDAAMVPPSYHHNNVPFEDLERPSHDLASSRFTMNSADQQPEWDDNMHPVSQHAAVNNTVAPAQTPYGDNSYDTTAPSQNQYGNNPFDTVERPSYQGDAVVGNYMPHPSYPYGNDPFDPTATAPYQPAATVKDMESASYRYDNTMAPSSHERNAAVTNDMAPPPPRLPTPPSSDRGIQSKFSKKEQKRLEKAAASKPPSGSGVNGPHRLSARHQGELDNDFPAERYVPGKVTKGTPGRPKGSKTQKAIYDQNGLQIFKFGRIEAVGNEFQSSGNLLRLTLHDSNGKAVKGAPKKKIGQANKDEKSKDKDGKPQNHDAPLS